MISAASIQALRARTNAGIADCKRALVETNGDIERAVERLVQYEVDRVAQAAANRAAVDALIGTQQSLESLVTELVASGFYTVTEIENAARGRFSDERPDMVSRTTREAVEKKTAENATWPAVTDCDRIDEAFAVLTECRIVALQNAGFTSSDGLECVEEHAGTTALGYCFYTYQDLMNVIRGRGLYLAFGSFGSDRNADLPIGHIIERELKATGLEVTWSRMAHERILLRSIAWQRRGPELGVALRPHVGAVRRHFIVG